MTKPLRVGIIGANAERGWARVSHVPAVQQLAGLELAAVATGRQQTAEAAATAFGAKAAYGNAQDMLRDPNVDLVAVCVKVPDHRDLVLGAVAAGKHVYCEWPLGCNLAESKELAAAAQRAGVHAVIGLQTRLNPAMLHARQLIASGAIGRVLSGRVLSTTVAFGPKVESAMAFAEQPENGVTLVSIQGAHTLDLAIALLGKLDDATALTSTQYPEVTIGDDEKQVTRQKRTTPDHLLVLARLAGGAPLMAEVGGGRPPNSTPFRLDVTGETGEVTLEGGAARGFQSGRLRLSLNGESQPFDERELASLPDEAANVAGVYAALRDDIAAGTSTVPGFAHAVRLTRLVDDILSAAQTGVRKPASDWP